MTRHKVIESPICKVGANATGIVQRRKGQAIIWDAAVTNRQHLGYKSETIPFDRPTQIDNSKWFPAASPAGMIGKIPQQR